MRRPRISSYFIFRPTAAFGVIISAYSAVTLSRERKHVNYSVRHPPMVPPTRLAASPSVRSVSSINLEISKPITNWTAVRASFYAARLPFSSRCVFSHQLLCSNVVTLSVSLRFTVSCCRERYMHIMRVGNANERKEHRSPRNRTNDDFFFNFALKRNIYIIYRYSLFLSVNFINQYSIFLSLFSLYYWRWHKLSRRN